VTSDRRAERGKSNKLFRNEICEQRNDANGRTACTCTCMHGRSETPSIMQKQNWTQNQSKTCPSRHSIARGITHTQMTNQNTNHGRLGLHRQPVLSISIAVNRSFPALKSVLRRLLCSNSVDTHENQSRMTRNLARARTCSTAVSTMRSQAALPVALSLSLS